MYGYTREKALQLDIEASSGDVWVEDNDPAGSRFVVELPTAE